MNHSRYLKTLKAYILVFFLGSLIIFCATAVSLDFYVQSSSLMAVRGWLDAELVSIQQGNLLTSVTKFQRVIKSSDLISAVEVIDRTKADRKLLTIGEPFIPLISDSDNQQPKIIRDGIIFSHQIIVNLKNQNIAIAFRVAPTISNSLFFIFGGSFLLLFWFFMVLVLIIEKNHSKIREGVITQNFQEKIDRLALIDKISAQVAHDIRSPLMALKIGLENVAHIPEDAKDLISNSIIRINDIGNDLLESRRHLAKEIPATLSSSINHTEESSKLGVAKLVSQIVKEKQTIFKSNANIQLIQENIDPLIFVNASAKEVERILANVIQNSYDAIPSQGEIRIGTRVYSDKTVIYVIDNGIGMSQETLSSLGRRAPFLQKQKQGKHSNGLGLSHAKTYLKSIDGLLEIQSSEGLGTMVQIIFSNKLHSI